MYLSKSRADIENEQHDDIDILKRHESILLELAHKMKICVTHIYREVVSDEIM